MVVEESADRLQNIRARLAFSFEQFRGDYLYSGLDVEAIKERRYREMAVARQTPGSGTAFLTC